MFYRIKEKGRTVIVTIHQPECLPWIGLIEKITDADFFVCLDTVNFEKNYFQNRQYIRTLTGKQLLTIPVESHNHKPIREVKIIKDGKWQEKMLKTIYQTYHLAPHFDKYYPKLRQVLSSNWETIADLNYAVLNYLLEAFNVKTGRVLASELKIDHSLKNSELLAAICQKVQADIYLSGPSGRDYLDMRCFDRLGIRVDFHKFTHPVYRQLYHGFEPGMSSIDLLFNEGKLI
jgi:hypothetical protein